MTNDVAPITVDCPSCCGAGGLETYSGSYFGPPDSVPCHRCDGSGQVAAVRCDICLSTTTPIVAKEDDLCVCERCHLFAEHADKACPECLEVVCDCQALVQVAS